MQEYLNIDDQFKQKISNKMNVSIHFLMKAYIILKIYNNTYELWRKIEHHTGTMLQFWKVKISDLAFELRLTNFEFQIFMIFNFWDMVNFVLQIYTELETKTTMISTVWGPDSLSSDTR